MYTIQELDSTDYHLCERLKNTIELNRDLQRKIRSGVKDEQSY